MRRAHAGHQQRRVDARQLAIPHPLAGVHVEEVIVEALVAGGVLAVALLAAGEKFQRRQRALDGRLARHEAAFNADGVNRQRHADGGDAGRPAVLRLVANKAIDFVDLVDEVVKGIALQALQVDGARIHRFVDAVHYTRSHSMRTRLTDCGAARKRSSVWPSCVSASSALMVGAAATLSCTTCVSDRWSGEPICCHSATGLALSASMREIVIERARWPGRWRSSSSISSACTGWRGSAWL